MKFINKNIDSLMKRLMSLMPLLAVTLLLLPVVISAQPLFTLLQVESKSGEVINDWIANNQAITIRLNSEESSTDTLSPAPEYLKSSQFQITLGNTDLSSLFEFRTQTLFFSGNIALPSGENQLTIKQLVDGQWREIGNQTLRVMTRAGFKQAEITPRLELSINSQLGESVSGDSVKSERPRYSDVTASIGVETVHRNDDFSIESNFNLLSVSNRQQAIQFGDRGNRARKLDLADYSVTINKGNHNITVGHTRYGSNSLLIDSLSRRGVSWNYSNDSNLSFSGAMLNGTDIVGFNNFFGLADRKMQYVNSLGFGLNTFTESRLSLRVEGTYLDAQRLSQNNFGIGEITSGESNQGMGFKFILSDSESKLNADLSLGYSRYENPEDANLNFGDQLVQLETETAAAYNFNISYALVQNWQSPWGSDVNISLNANQSKAEPLYQTLTAYVQSNIKNRLLNAQYQVGQLSGNLSRQTSQDNLDNIINLLTTKTTNDSLTMNLPLAEMFSSLSTSDVEDSQINWLPGLDYSYQQTHQFALNSPDADTSGFNGGSHLPNQLTTNHGLSGSWQLGVNSISTQTSYSLQDNRQIGREDNDYSSLQHSVSLNIQQNNRTAWSFSVAKNRQHDKKINKIQYSKSATVSFNWQSRDGLALSINYGLTKDDDSFNDSNSTATNADVGLSKSLVKDDWWLPMDGSISFRINYNDSELIDNVFDQRNRFGTKIAQLAFSFSFSFL